MEKQPTVARREAKLIEIAARWEWMCDLLDGKEVSDFALSFSEVRRLADTMLLTKENQNERSREG